MIATQVIVSSTKVFSDQISSGQCAHDIWLNSFLPQNSHGESISRWINGKIVQIGIKFAHRERKTQCARGCQLKSTQWRRRGSLRKSSNPELRDRHRESSIVFGILADSYWISHAVHSSGENKRPTWSLDGVKTSFSHRTKKLNLFLMLTNPKTFKIVLLKLLKVFYLFKNKKIGHFLANILYLLLFFPHSTAR